MSKLEKYKKKDLIEALLLTEKKFNKLEVIFKNKINYQKRKLDRLDKSYREMQDNIKFNNEIIMQLRRSKALFCDSCHSLIKLKK